MHSVLKLGEFRNVVRESRRSNSDKYTSIIASFMRRIWDLLELKCFAFTLDWSGPTMAEP